MGTRDQNGPVFLMNATSAAEAHAILAKLPLGRAKLMNFEVIELTLLTPLHLLLTDGWAKGSKLHPIGEISASGSAASPKAAKRFKSH